MRTVGIIGCVILGGVLLAMSLYLWGDNGTNIKSQDVVLAQDQPAPGQDNAGGGQRGGGQRGGGQRGARGGGLGAGGGPGGVLGQLRDAADPFAQLVSALADVNLHPDFNLTSDQEAKIQKIRDDVKAAHDQWRKDHEADFKKLADDVRAARQAGGGGGAAGGGGGGGGGQLRDLMQKARDLQATAPKTDDAIAAIKAILTDDQRKALEAFQAEKLKEQQQERQELMNQLGGPGAGGLGGGGGRGGRGGGGGGGGRGGAAQPGA